MFIFVYLSLSITGVLYAGVKKGAAILGGFGAFVFGMTLSKGFAT